MDPKASTDPPVFVINLDRSWQRREYMEGQANQLGLAYERISAVDGLNVPEWLRSEFDGPHTMSPGEVGCYASHLVVAQRIVCAAIDAAPPDWDLIHLSSVFKVPAIEVCPLTKPVCKIASQHCCLCGV